MTIAQPLILGASSMQSADALPVHRRRRAGA
jgi:hypothetical protein